MMPLHHPYQPDPDETLPPTPDTELTVLGAALTSFRARYAWNRHELARWLGISQDALGALAHEPQARLPLPADVCRALAERYAADLRRLETMFGEPVAARASRTA
jgi:hypothetical protein